MAEFVVVVGTNELGGGGMRSLEVWGKEVVRADVGGKFHAFDDACTRLRRSLAESGLGKPP